MRGPAEYLVVTMLVAAAALTTGGLAGAAARARRIGQRPTLTILTTTLGGVGRFSYIAGPYDDDPTEVVATTKRAGVPVRARPERNLQLLSSNRYVIQQLPFTKPDGRWALVRVVCNGVRRRVHEQPISRFRYVKLRLRFGHPTACSFVDRFVRAVR